MSHRSVGKNSSICEKNHQCQFTSTKSRCKNSTILLDEQYKRKICLVMFNLLSTYWKTCRTITSFVKNSQNVKSLRVYLIYHFIFFILMYIRNI